MDPAPRSERIVRPCYAFAPVARKRWIWLIPPFNNIFASHRPAPTIGTPYSRAINQSHPAQSASAAHPPSPTAPSLPPPLHAQVRWPDTYAASFPADRQSAPPPSRPGHPTTPPLQDAEPLHS